MQLRLLHPPPTARRCREPGSGPFLSYRPCSCRPNCTLRAPQNICDPGLQLTHEQWQVVLRTTWVGCDAHNVVTNAAKSGTGCMPVHHGARCSPHMTSSTCAASGVMPAGRPAGQPPVLGATNGGLVLTSHDAALGQPPHGGVQWLHEAGISGQANIQMFWAKPLAAGCQVTGGHLHCTARGRFQRRGRVVNNHAHHSLHMAVTRRAAAQP